MHHDQAKRALHVGAVLCFVAMLLPAASAAQRGSEAAAPASVTRSFNYAYNSKPPLLNSVKKTLKGDKTKDGNCIWHPAAMTLAPQDRALEQRQVSADYVNCTTVVEIGNPTEIEPIDANEQLSTTPTAGGSEKVFNASPARKLASRSVTITSSKAYYKVTWYDRFDATVNYLRSILTWQWGNDGRCVVGSIAEWAEFHLAASGWSISNWDRWKTTSCTDHRTHSSADFRNPVFCIPAVIETHYRNVRIRGGYTGTYGAALDSTWTVGTCVGFPLHWSGQVVKEF